MPSTPSRLLRAAGGSSDWIDRIQERVAAFVKAKIEQAAAGGPVEADARFAVELAATLMTDEGRRLLGQALLDAYLEGQRVERVRTAGTLEQLRAEVARLTGRRSDGGR